MEKKGSFNAPSSFSKLWIQKYYQNEPRFNGVFSRDNLAEKIKNGAYIINFDKYENCIALFCNRSEIVYFNSLKMFPKKLKNLSGIKT